MVKEIKSFVHMMNLSKPDYEEYCRTKRIENYEKNGADVSCLLLHSFAHHILVPIMQAELYIGGKRLIVLDDKRKKTGKPTIFCPTHIGGVDIEMAFCAIKTACWVLIGDPRELYKQLDGMFLQMNGWIPMDVPCKEDRIVAKARMTALLKKGGNLLMFPEGVLNISENALVGTLYAGAVDLAITCNADIVPIAFCRMDDNYYCMLGENIDYSNCDYENRFQLTTDLRDTMATLKWQIMEQIPGIKRSGIPADAYERFFNSVISFNTEYTCTMDDIKSEQFHPKNVTTPDDAFAYMRDLQPNKNNAFLYRDNQRFCGESQVH